jgi:hypothetical protein
MRKGDEIGRCVFAFAETAGRLEVRIDVRLVVRILSIPVYRWTHRATERWESDRLVAMVADTDDDGALRHVEVRRDAAGGLILTVDGERRNVDPEAIPASFWNPAVVTSHWVIDGVTGKAGRTVVAPINGAEAAPGQGGTMRRYGIASDAGLKQEIALSAAGRVVGFTAFAPDGSAIVYRPAPER